MSLWACATCNTLTSWRIPLVCPKCGAALNMVNNIGSSTVAAPLDDDDGRADPDYGF